MGRHSVMNVNTLPNKMVLFAPIGYIFTYGNKLPNLSSDKVKYEDIGSTFARCLDSYFIGKDAGDSKNIDLILACGSKDKIVPPALTEEIIIRCNSNDLIKNVKKAKKVKDDDKNDDEDRRSENGLCVVAAASAAAFRSHCALFLPIIVGRKTLRCFGWQQGALHVAQHSKA